MAEKTLTKKELERLGKELLHKRVHGMRALSAKEEEACEGYCHEYKAFLSKAKTEREAAREIASILGHSNIAFWQYREKAICAYRPGKKRAQDGIRLICTHIDAPRLDLKMNPLYEDLDMAFLKTHYYGGIKKFHWLTRPLALHGVVFLKDGQRVDITIGEQVDDPVFTINDLLPHLASKVQGEKKIRDAIPAEKLNVLFGGNPIKGPEDTKEAVKLNCLKILKREYGIVERDLISAELEIVPQGPPRDVGLDRAFVGGYGQDDRACAFAALKALTDARTPEQPIMALFLDKEEIGSDGNTGAKSRLIELALYEILRQEGAELAPDTILRLFNSSKAISGDVTAGIDPDYMEVHEKHNDAHIGYGVNLTKYTGARGKYSANDAHAEMVNWVTRVWDRKKVVWQAGELGRVDEGGGGTVAKYIASLGIDTVDAGPPLLSMHSPFEIAHKVDLYMTYKAYRAFFEG